jgi:hypothetical protein
VRYIGESTAWNHPGVIKPGEFVPELLRNDSSTSAGMYGTIARQAGMAWDAPEASTAAYGPAVLSRTGRSWLMAQAARVVGVVVHAALVLGRGVRAHDRRHPSYGVDLLRAESGRAQRATLS